MEKDAESTGGGKQRGPEGTRKWGTGRVTPSSQLPLLGSSDLPAQGVVHRARVLHSLTF